MASTQIDRLGAIPLAPAGLTATAVPGGFTLNWAASSDATIESYQVSIAPGASMPFSEALDTYGLAAPAITSTYAPGYGAAPLTVFLQAVGTGGASPTASVNVTPVFQFAFESIIVDYPGDFTNGQMNIAEIISVNGGSPETEFQATQGDTLWATQGLASAVVVPASSTTISEADAVFGAISNASTLTNSVAGRFQARAAANGAAVCFGLNVQAFDEGFEPLGIIGCEWDINAGNTATPTYGQNIIGIFPNGTPAQCTAIQISILDAIHPWGAAISSLNGAAITALSVGAAGTAAPSNSQSINLLAIDDSGTQHQTGILAQATTNGADLLLLTPSGGVAVNNLLTVGGLATFFAGVAVISSGGVVGAFYSAEGLVASPTASGAQITGASTLDLSSTTGISSSDIVSGPSAIANGVTVISVIDPTHVEISSPLAGTIASGVTIDFTAPSAHVGEIITDGTNITVGGVGGALQLGSTPGLPIRALVPVQLPSYTIAPGANALPAASAVYAGCKAYVADFSGSPTYHGAIGSGGGTTGTPVFCNGSAWLTD